MNLSANSLAISILSPLEAAALAALIQRGSARWWTRRSMVRARLGTRKARTSARQRGHKPRR